MKTERDEEIESKIEIYIEEERERWNASTKMLIKDKKN